MYAHVGSSDTILQRYDIKGIPTVGRPPVLVEIDMRVFQFHLMRDGAKVTEVLGGDLSKLKSALDEALANAP